MMPPLPASKLTELMLTRRKLFEKIIQNVATRKIQNSIQATGDRMSVTPQQFGMQVGKTMGKQAFLGPGLLGAGIGAATSPAGHRMEGASRGALKATGTSLGAVAGVPAGVLAALMLLKGKKLPRIPGRGIHAYPLSRRNAENLGKLYAAVGVGAPAGAAVGGGAGYAGTSALLGKPSWEGKQASGKNPEDGLNEKAEKKPAKNAPGPSLVRVGLTGAAGGLAGYGLSKYLESKGYSLSKLLAKKADTPARKSASVLSVLGGLAGGGLGGLAGGGAGGILGALGGGALGGGPGAGLGLLAGGAAGLGAGAHMGGNIGASIGAGFSKKKEKPESEEKEEKSEEKAEDSGDEEVKESAARVLAQLQKNAK